VAFAIAPFNSRKQVMVIRELPRQTGIEKNYFREKKHFRTELFWEAQQR